MKIRMKSNQALLWRRLVLPTYLIALFFPTGAAAQKNVDLPINGFVIRGAKLDADKPLWIVVNGAEMSDVNVTVRSSLEQQVLLTGNDSKQVFQNYTDFENARNVETHFRVIRAETLPNQVTTQPVDLQISSTDKQGTPARIDQVGTSTNSKRFTAVLNSQQIGRDQVLAFPRRCYAKKTDAILINIYTEHTACALLNINDKNGKLVPPKKQRFFRKRPILIPWQEHQKISPGVYQARVLLWYADTPGECDSLLTDNNPDFVLYSDFQILDPP